MEAGFDLKAIPVVMLGGGAAVVKGNVAPSGLSAPASISLRETASGLESSTFIASRPANTLCRVFALLDDRVNAEGFERIFWQLKTACVSVGRCGQRMSRPLFMFRPNLQNEEHRQAWALLQAVPEGQKSAFLVKAILDSARQDVLESTLRRILREELQAVPSQPVQQPEEAIPQEMIGFLNTLMDDE